MCKMVKQDDEIGVADVGGFTGYEVIRVSYQSIRVSKFEVA